MSYAIMNMTDYEAICNALRQKMGTNDLLLFNDVYNGIKCMGATEAETFSDSIIDGTVTKCSNNRITEISPYVFYERDTLTEVDFPNVTTINEYAFYGCGSLTSVYMPNLVTAKLGAFNSCTKLLEIDFPKLESAGGDAFRSIGLTTCYFPKLKTIGDATFGYNKFTEVTDEMFPELTNAPIRAFRNCTPLTYVKLSKVTTTGSNTFYQDTALTKADFTALTSLVANTFNGCTNLETLILRNENKVVSLGAANAATVGTLIHSGTGYIYVPSALVDSYKTATNWSTYANQIRAIEEYPEICGA